METKIVKAILEITQELGKDEASVTIKVEGLDKLPREEFEKLYIYEVVRAAVDGIGSVTGSYTRADEPDGK